MKKRNSVVVALVAAALFVGAQTAQAGSVADGAYVGVEGGFGATVVGAKTTDNDGAGQDAQAFGITNGGLGLDGASYGAFMGYGFRMSSLYIGMEANGRWTDMELEPDSFTVQIRNDVAGVAGTGADNTVTNAKASAEFNGSVTGRLGYYINPNTLFTVNGGLTGGMFEVSWDGQSEEYWDPGTTYGVGMESTLFDGIAVRVSWNVVDYYNAEVFGLGTMTEKPGNVSVEIQPSLSVAHLGLMYTF